MDKAAKVREKKRKWREKHYKSQMGNRAEGHGFADKKKQKFIHDYKKLLRKEAQQSNVKDQQQKPVESKLPPQMKQFPVKRKENKEKKSRFHEAEKEFQKRKDIKKEEKAEKMTKQKAVQEAIQNYQSKKKKQQKLLAKKNFRGQPNMASRMTLLLSKIEEMQKS